MIDPLVSLSFAMQSNKGVYALLLGSGVSRAAGIPTGWDIVRDLITKIASASGEDAGAQPDAWYRTKFNKEPDYSELLGTLCVTPTERQKLLAPYFEPNDDERAQGLKSPTKAHKAIAKLVAQGIVRVIVTTNFDRLLERAIQDEGIAPVVLSTADAIEGAMPIAHQKACIIKLHGDYHDTRIKNTASELDRYDPRVDRILDEVFDSFGLVVCGWSAQWDTALKAAIDRTKSRRFTTFFACKGQPSTELSELASRRAGVCFTIDDADAFFLRLQMQIEGIEQSRQQHPTSIDALTSLTKRLLAEPTQAIALSDLIHNETEGARNRLQELPDKIKNENTTWESALRDMRAAIERISAVLVSVTTWGDEEVVSEVSQAIQRIVIFDVPGGGLPNRGQRLYPAIVLIYVCSLSAISRSRWSTVRRLLEEPTYEQGGNRMAIVFDEQVWSELHEWCVNVPCLQGEYFKISKHLSVALRNQLLRQIPDDSMFQTYFDRFEHIMSLRYLERCSHDACGGASFVPMGCFILRNQGNEADVIASCERALDMVGGEWPPLKAGMFRGSVSKVKELQLRLLESARRVVFRRPLH